MTSRQLLARLSQRTVPGLIRIACVLALIGLTVMILPMLVPSAVTVITSMAIGHLIGVGAGAMYVLAIFLDVARRRDE
jgi:hypothetical protein